MASTKIVATVGPASASAEMIGGLFEAGVDVFRLNMSHGNHETHAEVIQWIREVARRARRPAGILCDLSGPKIRIGIVNDSPVTITEGAAITITTDPLPEGGTSERVSCNYKELPLDVQPGQQVSLDDGLLELVVRQVRGTNVHCEVVRGGPLSSNKGLNLPNTRLRISSLTEKDRADIEFGLAQDVDFFALSFVKRVQDLEEARYFIKFRGGSIPIIAKIEKGEAVENIESILESADGAMVARGDLGVEIPVEQVPHVQKRVIALCNRLGKPVITATQMLDSMIRSSRPTRAEVTDVANAILDGTDAVMLSGETASGQFPLEAVRVMNRIAEETETHLDHAELLRRRAPRGTVAQGGVQASRRSGVQEETGTDWDERSLLTDGIAGKRSVSAAIAHGAARIAHDIEAKAILCLTQGGSTPRRVARHRPAASILAYCPLDRTAQQLCLTWGVRAQSRGDEVDVEGERREGIEAQFQKAIRCFREGGDVAAGDRLVVTAGLPLHEPGTTNLIRVLEVE